MLFAHVLPHIQMIRLNRSHIAFSHDVIMAAASFLVAFYLRVGDALFGFSPEFLINSTLLFTFAAAAVFWPMGLYRGIWRYASMNDMVQITKAVTLVVLIYVPVMFVASRAEDLPRSQPIINWFVLIAMLGGPRFVYRLLKDGRLDFRFETIARVPVLLIGAGHAAEAFVRATVRDGAAYRVVGILDEKGSRVGRRIHNIPVLGGLGDLRGVVESIRQRGEGVQRVVVTKENIDGGLVRAWLDEAEALGLTLSRLPRLTDFQNEGERPLEVRPIAVEDLLGRPQAVLDRPAMRALIKAKRVLITGAGGTIGSELTRQIAALAPARLTLVDNGEFNLYSIEQELVRRHPELPHAACLADVRARHRVDEIMRDERPHIIFHAAALKHVPIVEDHPCEGVLTNVMGTCNVADACRANGVGAMVLVSTDKAVDPSSVMGTTKRIAESYCQALDIDECARAEGPSTRYLTVRFGNVLGSTGSVVPLFQRQIADGGPLTVTHPAATRYFMTVREAVELVLQASSLRGQGAGRIFVLEMGEPVRIVDLARQMIRLSGKRPDADVPIVFTGLRPGEKLHEQLFHDSEAMDATDVAGIKVAAPRAADLKVLSRAVGKLGDAAASGDTARTLQLLHRLVPEFAGAAETAPPPAAATG